ncbi:ABC transporter permease [Neobacillus mesonae]|nr:ABC transporter permease [Neobacillus mesonae]
MIRLMKLEIRRNRLSTYLNAAIISSIVLIGFIYFIAYVAQVENEADFQNYPNIFLFTSVISMLIFCVLSSVMYSRFVIEEYSGSKLLLLFSYPLQRGKVLLAKVAVIVLFTTIAMFLSMVPAFLLFSLTETISPIVNDTLSIDLILSLLKIMIVFSISVNGISLAAMRIGFVNKSTPTAIISAFILCALLANAIIGSFGNDILLFSFLAVFTAVGLGIVMNLSHKVEHMEVE